MGKVILDMSMSLDGFVTASNQRPEEPMGDGGLRLLEWALSDEDDRGRELLSRSADALGAVLTGRRTYDTSLPWWGADGPTGERRLPVFVVTHVAPSASRAGGGATCGPARSARAGKRATAAAGDKIVGVSGARVGQQSIRAGLVDEISVHLVPVLFGSGTRMFEHLGDEHIQLEAVEAIETAATIHLRFRIAK